MRAEPPESPAQVAAKDRASDVAPCRLSTVDCQLARQRGFTLAEVLVAIAILGMIGALTFGTFARVMTARQQAEAITSYYHEIRQAMLRMSREISMAFLSEAKRCDEPSSQTVFMAQRTGGGMRLDFTSFSHAKTVKDANESDQSEVSYFVDRDPEDSTKSALLRRVQSRIDDEPEEGGVEEVLASNITDLRFEFYDPREDRWDEEWDTTTADYARRLPMFVRIELEAKGPNGKEETFVTKTRVFLKQPILIAGTGTVRCAD